MHFSRTFWVTLVIIIATFLRLYQLDALPPGFYPDEAMYSNNALEVAKTGEARVYYPENNGREGLWINMQSVVLPILIAATGGHPEPWMPRLLAAVFGILTVLGTYFLAKELFRNGTGTSTDPFQIRPHHFIGIVSAFFIATSFWHILFSRIAFRAILAPLLLVWALFFFLKALREAQNGRSAHWISSAVIGGFVFGLGFYTYIAYRVSPLIFLAAIPFFHKQQNFWKTVGAFTLTAVIVALPIGIYYLQNPADFLGRTSQVSVFSAPSPLADLGMNIVKTAGMFFVAGDYNWRHNFAGRPELFAPVGLAFLLGLALALWSWIRRSAETKRVRFASLVLFLWLGLTALPVVVSNEGIPHALRAILMIPPIMILAGLGAHACVRFFQEHLSKRTVVALGTVAVIALTLEPGITYFARWGHNPNVPGAFSANYVEIGRMLSLLPDHVQKYVIVKAGGADVRGIPMPAQTVMFMTDTFREEERAARNITYILPNQASRIPPGAFVVTIE